MDYNIKYLKYKYKYINLKNLIGNGPKLTDSEKLIAANIHPKIAESIISNKLNISKAIKLMTTLKGVRNTLMRSLLILQLLINNIPDKKIDNLNKLLFRYNLVFVRNISFNCIINMDEAKLSYLAIILYVSKFFSSDDLLINPNNPVYPRRIYVPPIDTIVIQINKLLTTYLEEIFREKVRSSTMEKGFIYHCVGDHKKNYAFLKKNSNFIFEFAKDLTEAESKFVEEALTHRNMCVSEGYKDYVKKILAVIEEYNDKNNLLPNINPDELIESNEKLEELIKEIVSQKK